MVVGNVGVNQNQGAHLSIKPRQKQGKLKAKGVLFQLAQASVQRIPNLGQKDRQHAHYTMN